MNLHTKVREYCRKHRLLQRGDGVLVAVSGGPDSIALLQLLRDLQDDFSLRLEVAHVEHGMRGSEGKHDARFVQVSAERLGLRFHLGETDIPLRRSRAGGGNLEQLARQERYRFFFATARAGNLNKIATAHTENDQAETVLMWLLRGAGGQGLGAITPARRMDFSDHQPQRCLTLIRPLLATSKKEIFELLEERNLKFCFDHTNDDTALLRNWLRHDLLPRVEQRVDPGVPSRLAHTAEVLRDEALFIESLAQERLGKLCANGSLNCNELQIQPRALQRQILRLWFKRVRGDLRRIDFDHIEKVLELVSQGPPQAQLAIPGGWQFIREYDSLRLDKGAPGPTLPYCYALQPGATLTVSEAGVVIQTHRVSRVESAWPSTQLEAIFDLDALSAPLVVRNFRPGDRFQPLGMAGHKKVKDLFIEKKAPYSTRALLPLLVMGREVLWLPGYGRSETGRIGPDSQHLLHLRLIKTGHEE
jgi:tRNA(Ile)-lysidine synthase